MLYLQPFLIALVISGGLSLMLVKWKEKLSSKKIKLERRRIGERHWHQEGVSRWGGIAIFFAFMVAISIDQNLIVSKQLAGVLLGGTLIWLIGLLDDWRELNWKVQLLFQILAICLLFIFGAKIDYITNPLGGIIYLASVAGTVLGFVWSLILINSINWLDGLDGLSGGVVLIGALTIFLLALNPEVNQPPVGIVAVALAGAVLGFLIFNFYPAKIMAGTSGAFFMGFILAGLSIFAGAKIATTLLVLVVPIADFFWVMWNRFSSGKSIFSPDKQHLHHKLKQMGWSSTKISLTFYGITITIAGVTLNVQAGGKMTVLVLSGLIMLLVYSVIKQKYEL